MQVNGSTPAAAAAGANLPRVLTAAVLGSATGISALLLYTNGLFVAGLTHDFGLTRTEFGLGVFLVTVALAAANPLVGWATDRWGPRRPAIAGMLLLAAGFAAMALIVHSVLTYLLLQTLLAFAGAASGPVAYTKMINATFGRHRGFALGITMTGIGLTAALIPPEVSKLIAAHGWRFGFWILALVPLFGAASTAALVPRRLPGAEAGLGEQPPRTAGLYGTKEFRVMACAFALMALSFAGLLPHFVPMLMDQGLSAIAAGRLAGEIGIAVIFSRLIVGYLLDRVFAPRIASVICLLTAAGCAFFLLRGASDASVTAVGLGCAIGAELDLMGYLVARYFPLPQYGKVYGVLYCIFIFASGLSPLWVGALRDATGNYSWTLVFSIAGLLLSSSVFLFMPRPRQPAHC